MWHGNLDCQKWDVNATMRHKYPFCLQLTYYIYIHTYTSVTVKQYQGTFTPDTIGVVHKKFKAVIRLFGSFGKKAVLKL